MATPVTLYSPTGYYQKLTKNNIPHFVLAISLKEIDNLSYHAFYSLLKNNAVFSHEVKGIQLKFC